MNDAAFARAVAFLVQKLSAPRTTPRVLIVDPDLKILASHGFSQDVPSAEHLLDFSVSVLREVLAKGGRPRFDGDLQALPELTFSAHLSQVRSLICVPFYAPTEESEHHVIQGLVYADNRDQAYSFTHAHFNCVHALCRDLQIELYGQAAVVCEPPEADFREPTSLEKLREAERRREEERRQAEARALYQDRFEISPALRTCRPPAAAMLAFYRQLQVLYHAGVPLVGGLHTLAQMHDTGPAPSLDDLRQPGLPPPARRLGWILHALATLLSRGHRFGQSLAEFPGAFPAAVSQLVRAGEESGSLGPVLEELARYEETRQSAWRRLSSALVYPLFSLVLAALMLLVIPAACAQGLAALLRDSGQPLGWGTRVLLALADTAAWLATGWHGILFGLVLAGTGGMLLRRWRRRWSPEAAERLTVRALHWPVVGRVLRLSLTVRLARSLALMLRTGLSASQSLELAVKSTGNPVLARELPLVIQAVEHGASLSESLARFSPLPGSFPQLARAGEESGALPRLLDWLADFYEEELELAVEQYVAWAEPLVVALVGLIVGLVVLAMLGPLVAVLERL